jgi:DnaA-like protein
MTDRPYLDFETHIAALVTGPRGLPMRQHSSFAAKSAAPPAIPNRDSDPFEVLRVVAQAYSLSVADITGKDKHKNTAEARCVACWLLRTRTKLSFPEIGRILRKDHTTIMVGVKKCGRLREGDAGFGSFTDKLAVAVDARLKGAVG